MVIELGGGEIIRVTSESKDCAAALDLKSLV